MREILFAALIVAASPASARDYPPIMSSVTPIQVAPHAYYVQGGAGLASAANEGYNSNAGFVVTADGVVVIDALGTPALGNAFLGAIRSVTRQEIGRASCRERV